MLNKVADGNGGGTKGSFTVKFADVTGFQDGEGAKAEYTIGDKTVEINITKSSCRLTKLPRRLRQKLGDVTIGGKKFTVKTDDNNGTLTFEAEDDGTTTLDTELNKITGTTTREPW